MWRRHPGNDSPEAWQDMLDTMVAAVKIAATHGVILGFEPEVSNVVDTAAKGRLLLDTVRSPHLKVLMDAANLYHAGDLARMDRVLDGAFDLLGRDIVLAHAKDLSHDGAAGDIAAGKGRLDYDRYLALLRSAGYTGPLIMHSLRETEVDESIVFLRGKLV
jgi:sugar phosphate isomerase/epimerase